MCVWPLQREQGKQGQLVDQSFFPFFFFPFISPKVLLIDGIGAGHVFRGVCMDCPFLGGGERLVERSGKEKKGLFGSCERAIHYRRESESMFLFFSFGKQHSNYMIK